jgi:DNA modification methylase
MAVNDQTVTDRYALYNGDCVEVMQSLPDRSVKLSVYSPPFGGLYNYSSDPRDMSNCDSYSQFFDHYAYVIRELHRLTLPGRVSAVHVADVPSGNNGSDHLRDFSGDVIRAHEREGWHYAARYSIWKEPLDVYIRTMAKNLQHRSLTRDSAFCSCAAADYLLIFRKPGANPEPVKHPTGLMEYIGAREVPESLLKYRGHTGNQIENRYSQWVWRQYASAFWDDIRAGNVLPFHDCKDPEDEKHVHPLQLDVIERAVILWSNPGDVVLTPFMGVGSEVFGAVKHGRRGVGAELKNSYYRQALANLASLSDGGLRVTKAQDRQASLFDAMDGDA